MAKHSREPATVSGRLVKQEQWERWLAKRKLVSESKHWGAPEKVYGKI